MQQVNVLAVFAATAAGFTMGGIWYAPFVFGKTWMALIGKTQKSLQRKAFNTFLLGILVNLFMAFMLAQYLKYLNLHGAWDGTIQGFCIGIGFVATNTLMETLFAQRSVKLYFINAGQQVANLALMGAVLGAWG